MTLLAARMGAPIQAGLVAAGAVGAGTSALALAIATAVIDELTGNAIVPSVPPLGFVAAPPAVNGQCPIANLSVDRLRTSLRAALVASGAANTQKTTDSAQGLAQAIVDELQGRGVVYGAGFVANPAGGALTGAGGVSGLSAVLLSATINSVLESPMGAQPGAPTAALALAIAGAIVLELATFAVVPPGLLVSPPLGGAVTGASVIT